MAKIAILVVEDDPDIRELLSFSLAKEGWSVSASATAEEGLAALSAGAAGAAAGGLPDCLVLDVMLPGMDGLELLRALKADPAMRRLPIILASARGEEADVVAGLELGAEDYVVKPYSPRVLAARVRAALRRRAEAAGPAPGTEAKLAKGPVELDPARHEARVGGKPVDLSATEFALLEFLMRSPGWVRTRGQIIDAVKGRDYPVTDRAVDVQVLSLRRKLGSAGTEIETVRGVGYRFRD